MRIAVALAATVSVAGCSKKPDIKNACVITTAPAVGGVAWMGRDRLHWRRGDQRGSVEYASQPCLKAGDDADLIALSPDGKTAWVVGERAAGGSIHHNVRHETTLACRVDLETGAAEPLGISALVHQIRHQRWKVGPLSGWIYLGQPDGLYAVDPAGKGVEPLGIDSDFDHCDLTERGDAVIVACARYTGRSVADYDFRVEITELSRAWPPARAAQRSIDVDGRADRAFISRDGRWIAYAGTDFRTHTLGLIDASKGAVAYEHVSDGERSGPLLVADDGTALVTAGSSLYTLAPDGAERSRKSVKREAYKLFWLDRDTALHGGCEFDRLAFP